MTNSFYFIGEFVSLLDKKKGSKAIGALLAVFLFIGLIYVLLLPQEQPLKLSSGLEKFPENHNTLAQIESGLSSSAINDLYLSLRRLDSVENLILVLSEEVKQGVLNVPEELSPDSDFFLIETANREKLLSELKTQPQIVMVTKLTGKIRQSSDRSLALWMKVLVLLVGIFLAGLAFYLLKSLTEDLLDSWEGELQIIKYTGLSRASVKFPLVLLGTGLGLAGSVLSVLVLVALSTWSNTGLWIAKSLQGFLDNTSLLITVIWSLVIGLALGFLASLASLRAVDEKWET